MDELARWKAELGVIKVDDHAAANAAVSLAATWRELEAEAHASGMHWLLHWLQDGHIPLQDGHIPLQDGYIPLAALGELKITVKGTDVHIGVPGRTFATLGVNPANIGAKLRAAGD